MSSSTLSPVNVPSRSRDASQGSDIAISVQDLAKSYTIVHEERQTTLIHTAMARAKNPLQRPEKETFWALNGVSFDVKRGEVVGIIGRNGAGKSTLLKVLSRITEPTRGRAILHGRVGSLLEVGTGFHPELTGRENVYLNGAILGMTRREINRQFDAIVDFSGTEKFLDTPVKRYSSGMYVRLAFAVAAHLNPEILIVDEVLAVGDAEFQKKCLGKMQEVAEGGERTVLFVSHNEAAVRRICQTCIFLKGGAVEFIGTPNDAFQRYRGENELFTFNPEHRKHSSPDISINDAYFSVDGIPSHEFLPGQNILLTFVVSVSASVDCAPELLVRDSLGTPVLSAAHAHWNGTVYRLNPGTHSLSFEIELPFLASGKYMVDIGFAQPRVLFYDYIEEALTFNIVPTTMAGSGYSFEQSGGYGYSMVHMRARFDETPLLIKF